MSMSDVRILVQHLLTCSSLPCLAERSAFRIYAVDDDLRLNMVRIHRGCERFLGPDPVATFRAITNREVT